MIFIMRVLIFSLIPLLMFSGIFFSNSHAFASYESELDDFKIKLQELNELFSYHEFKLISENKQGNNAEGGIKKIVQSFYNDDIVFKSNIRLEISQFDSHQKLLLYLLAQNNQYRLLKVLPRNWGCPGIQISRQCL